MVHVEVILKPITKGHMVVAINTKMGPGNNQTVNTIIDKVQPSLMKFGMDSIEFRENLHDTVRKELHTLDAMDIKYTLLTGMTEVTEVV